MDVVKPWKVMPDTHATCTLPPGSSIFTNQPLFLCINVIISSCLTTATIARLPHQQTGTPSTRHIQHIQAGGDLTHLHYGSVRPVKFLIHTDLSLAVRGTVRSLIILLNNQAWSRHLPSGITWDSGTSPGLALRYLRKQTGDNFTCGLHWWVGETEILDAHLLVQMLRNCCFLHSALRQTTYTSVLLYTLPSPPP